MVATQWATFQQNAALPARAAQSASISVAAGRRRPKLVIHAASDSAAAAVSPATAPPSAMLALKEWAPTCAAIAAGEQTVRVNLKGGARAHAARSRLAGCSCVRCASTPCSGWRHTTTRLSACSAGQVCALTALHVCFCPQILLRKGGIKEPTFKPAAREFMLFPTSFHTDAQARRSAAPAGRVRSGAEGALLLPATTLLTCTTATCHTPAGGLSIIPALQPSRSPPPLRRPLKPPTPPPAVLQLLKPDAAQRYAAECAFDPKAQPVLRFGTWATLTGAWTTADPEVLHLLDGLHVWAPGFLVRPPLISTPLAPALGFN